jgi:hypothetical protein
MADYGKQPASRLRFGDILYSKREGIALITLNRPDVYNAYSAETLRELKEAFRDACWDDSVWVVVLTGAGDKAFCSGSDANEFCKEFLRWTFSDISASPRLRVSMGSSPEAGTIGAWLPTLRLPPNTRVSCKWVHAWDWWIPGVGRNGCRWQSATGAPARCF